MALVGCAQVLGLNVAPLVAVGGAGSLIIGLATQQLLTNAVMGMSLVGGASLRQWRKTPPPVGMAVHASCMRAGIRLQQQQMRGWRHTHLAGLMPLTALVRPFANMLHMRCTAMLLPAIALQFFSRPFVNGDSVTVQGGGQLVSGIVEKTTGVWACEAALPAAAWPAWRVQAGVCAAGCACCQDLSRSVGRSVHM